MSLVRNARAHYFGGGVEPADPTAFEIVHDEPHAVLRRYSAADAAGHPILLVPPLAVHVSCFDLRADQSLVAHLVAADVRCTSSTSVRSRSRTGAWGSRTGSTASFPTP